MARRVEGPPGLTPDILEAVKAMGMARRKTRPLGVFTPTTDDELWDYIKVTYGIEVPRYKVCEHHDAPFTAFANAYFGRDEVALWLGSRGFGGKTFLSALLSFVEETTLGAEVNLLGGSLEQAINGHEYTKTLWHHDNSPKHLLVGDPTARETRLTNGGRERVLAASSKSVRGPHPQRLRIDEADESEISIIDSALGQPMSRVGIEGKPDIQSQVLFTSTHHYPNGPVTALKKRAMETQGWKIYTWCYRESLKRQLPDGSWTGWLSQKDVDTARRRVTAEMFKVEYDLQEPSVGNRAIESEAVNDSFDKKYGNFTGGQGEKITRWCCARGKKEGRPCKTHLYVTGVDWGKQRDWSVYATYRVDCDPWWLVEWERAKELPWPVLLQKARDRMAKYPGRMAHDASSMGGDMANDFLGIPATPVVLNSGLHRTGIFVQYILAIENRKLLHPYIDTLWYDHYYVSTDDLFVAGGHPPDSFIAGALAWSCANTVTDFDIHPMGVGIGSTYFGNW